MTRRLVLIHGRAQEGKDALALKGEWLDTLREGLSKGGLSLPIAEDDVRFPFYGDTLFDLSGGKPADAAAEVIVRGDDLDDDEQRFARAIMEEVRTQAGISEDQLAEVAGQDVVDRGPLNWEWVQGILRAIDRYVPGGSSKPIALFTRDVYQYLKNPAIRETIDEGVSAAMTPGVETVVVAHSLGTVVAYNVLRRMGHERGWKVPLFVTVGSPLALTEVRKTLRGLAPIRCPECVGGWYNALDERDVVALYPLDTRHFPLDPAAPAIENKRDVHNHTTNRHGIVGYLNDEEVARRIHDGLKD